MSEKGTVHRQQGTFGKSPIALLTDAKLSDGAARLYAYMHWRYGSNKNNFEGRESMAEALGRSARTISNYLHELEQSDWIVILYRKSKQGRATSFYHVFETQADCIAWRREHRKPKPAREKVKTRKGRAGIGGKPTHKDENNIVNSSSQSKSDGYDLNSSSDTTMNSSSDNPDTSYPDTKDDNNSDPVASSESPTPPPEKQEPEKPSRSRQSDPDLAKVSKAFESEIGMITPYVADKLRAACDDYPTDWIVEAIGRAVEQNKRKWSYVNGILQNWRVEGKTEKPSNGSKPPTLSPPDPNCPTCEGRGWYNVKEAGGGSHAETCECRKAVAA